MRYPIAIELGSDTATYGVVVPDLPGCFRRVTRSTKRSPVPKRLLPRGSMLRSMRAMPSHHRLISRRYGSIAIIRAGRLA